MSLQQNKSLTADSVNLTNCDREPIRFIGSVQEHGYFVAFRLNDKTIYHASENIQLLTGKSLTQVLDQNMEHFFSPAFVEKVLEVAKRLEPREAEHISSRISENDTLYDTLIYKWDGLIALEFEKIQQASNSSASFTKAIKNNQSFLDDFHSCKNLRDAAKLLCRNIRAITDFDRVMLYRYLPTWDGEVIAEDKIPDMHSFLNHKFPASDIPLPARQLYLENRTRQIVKSSAGSVAIKPEIHYLTRKPIDLSLSKLRAVSPIHLQYLRNMGVTSSFSVAVIVDDQLWGLIACHGLKEKIISHEVRISCETLASTFAVFATMMQELEVNSSRINFDEKMHRLFRNLRMSTNPIQTLFVNHEEVDQLFSSTGIAFASRERVEIAGITLPLEETKKLASLMRERFIHESKTIIAIDNLSSVDSRFKEFAPLASGALAIYSGDNDQSVFIIFRIEALRTSNWGGDPRKILEKRGYQGQINPRQSFDTWSETVGGFSAAWSSFEIQGAEFLRDFVFDGLVRKEHLLKELGQQIDKLKSQKEKPR